MSNFQQEQITGAPLYGVLHYDAGLAQAVLRPGRIAIDWSQVAITETAYRGYMGMVGEYRPALAVIVQTGQISATCRADGTAQAWAVGTVQPKNVVGECRADGVGNAYVDLAPLPGGCRADGVAQAWAVGYVRSFAQADGQATAAVAKIIQRIKGLRADGQATAICDSKQVRQATARADGHASAMVLASLGLPLTCIVDDGALPSPSPASPRNYAR